MVCIIDDREDVWNYARNLICVQPYVFFKNTGDINDPNQQKQELQKSIKQPISTESKQPQAIKTPEVKTKSKKSSPKSSKSTTDQNVLTENLDSNSADSTSSNSTISSSSSSSTNSKSDSNMESGFDMKSKANNKQQNKENNQTNKTKHTEQQDQENDDDYDPDDYLVYLENILRLIHDEYYRIYEQRLKSKSPATTISNVNQVDEADLPDLKKVLPLIKSKVLENVVITFSGVVPTGYDLRKQRCYLMATSLGAKVNEHLCLPENTADTPDKEEGEENKKTYEYSYDDDETSSSSNCSGGANSRLSTTSKKRYTTHLVAAKYGTSKVHEASKCSGHKINVVTPEWLINSNYRWMKCDEKLFGLTKEYDYKNCMFHNEYNMHQKLSAVNNPHIIQPPKQLLPASKRNINNVSINQMNKPDSESKTKKYKLEEENSNSYEDMKINEDLLM
jgi:RNA polymerase II subunit A-like phosphatase